MSVLITGGCGYVGSVLVPFLLEQEYKIKVVDSQWFGNNLSENQNLEILKKEIAEINEGDLKNIKYVIHLANIANDPSVELNPNFSWEVNVLHTNLLLEKCKRVGTVEKFIYASSGSVYGVRPESKVTEEIELTPISIYNKTKMTTERVVSSYLNDFQIFNVRPATVCGVSPRMRFDVVVNMFVLQAYKNNAIKVLGGDQVRPNIHIKDMARVYLHFLQSDSIESGSYNAGFQNLLVSEIANMVSKLTGAKISLFKSNDPRSYRQDSSKLLATGFKPNYSVEEAIDEIYRKLKSGDLIEKPSNFTVDWMKTNQIGIN